MPLRHAFSRSVVFLPSNFLSTRFSGGFGFLPALLWMFGLLACTSSSWAAPISTAKATDSPSASSAHVRAESKVESSKAIAQLKQRGQYTSLIEAIGAARSKFVASDVHGQPVSKGKAARRFEVESPQQKFTASLNARGVEVQSMSGHKVGVALQSVGRTAMAAPLGAATLGLRGEQVELRRAGVVEWYRNTPQGLEQGFTLAKAPAGRAGQMHLTLTTRGASVKDTGGRAPISGRFDVFPTQGVGCRGQSVALRDEGGRSRAHLAGHE